VRAATTPDFSPLRLPFETPTTREASVSKRQVLRLIARLNVGGPARHVLWLTEGLQAHGYATHLVTGVVAENEADMSEEAVNLGIPLSLIPHLSREIGLRDVRVIVGVLRKLLAVRPEILHTHTAKAGATGRIAGFLYRWLAPGVLVGRPRRLVMVHTFHGHVFHSYYGKWKTRFFLAIERILARVTDRIVVISPLQLQEIRDRFRVGRAEQFALIPLGLDLAVYNGSQTRREKLRREWAAGNEVLVGIVGRLTEIKNHAMFLDVAARYRELGGQERRRTRFIVIGDGHLRTALERRATELGVESDVLFVGNRLDSEYFYPALDVVALTSLNEGTPLSLIEALANRRAVIATAVGGVVDIVGPIESRDDSPGVSHRSRGLTTESGDVAAFCRGLSRLISDAELRRTLGQAGENHVLANFSKQRLLADVDELYETLLTTNAGAEERVSSRPGLSSRYESTVLQGD